ncbi:cytochrome P450 2U1-like [Glandiceps talaboti]
MTWMFTCLLSFDAKTFSILLLLVLLFSLWYLRQPTRTHLPPSPSLWNIIRSFAKNEGQLQEVFTDLFKQLGPVFTIKLWKNSIFVINGYDAVSDALVGKAEFFSDRPEMVADTRGITFCKYGNMWKRRREFTLRALRYFLCTDKRCLENAIVEEAQHLVAAIQENHGSLFDIRHVLNRFVANVIFEFCTGKRFDNEDRYFRHMIECITKLYSRRSRTLKGFLSQIFLQNWRVYPKIHESGGRNYAKQILEDFIRKSVDEHRTTFDPEDTKDMIDLHLLENLRNSERKTDLITDELIIGEIFDLIVAGTDITTQTMTWIVLYLVADDDLQIKIQQQIDEIVGKNRSPSLSDMSKLPLIDATIAEILRLHTTTPLGVPHATSVNVTFYGYDIPKNSTIFINMWSVHQDTKHWSKPTEFNPSRFLDRNGKFMRNIALLPFSTGKRSCIGERLAKTVLFLFTVTILQHFDLRHLNNNPDPRLDGKLNMLGTTDFEIIAIKR